MSNEQLRAIWDFFDAITLPALRGPLTSASSAVKHATGIWFHPSMFESLGALALIGAGYCLVVFLRRAKTQSGARRAIRTSEMDLPRATQPLSGAPA
jgi:hypothetical protein